MSQDMEQQTGTPTTPAGVVAAANGLVANLDETLWAAKTSEELVEAVAEAETLRAHLAGLEASMLAEIEARKVPKQELAWSSTAGWFTHLAGMKRGQGHRTVEQAPLLVGERTATHAALLAGRVSPEQAAIIVAAVEKLPLNPSVRAEGEELLLEAASRLTATELHHAAKRLVLVVDPDKAERDAEKALDREDRAAHLHRHLSITEDGAGGIRLRGRGTVEDAAILKAAFLPLTKPEPAVDPETCEENVDPRDHGARLWDALVATAQHALDTDLPPDCHGARPRVTVTTSLEVLRQQIDWATLGTTTYTTGASTAAPLGAVTDDGLELAPSVIRRLACDADIIPVALGGRGEVLDVGRTCRLVTPAIWRAVVCRDRHCTFPGCTRPPIMCHAHHITHWADGGHTNLENLVLLCGQHHRVIHHTPWQVRLNPHDGRPEFRPPPKRGHPPPDWIRSRPRRE
ncbi:HNH endonuclease signature motif containing protein [Nocardioides koreensis]|uniref:HNH endonuclease signature motif containing protein n=2 Tax=Nocardioides koreensis TaxID=433651 RepID=A0ABN2ZIZ8_9ACTN